jgi:hypothetical protein
MNQRPGRARWGVLAVSSEHRDAGCSRLVPVTEYPLVKAAQAHEDIAARRRSGVTVLVP